MTHLPPSAIKAGAKTPEEIASEIVGKLNFTSNRIVNGRWVGEQYFAKQAIAEAIRDERARLLPALASAGCAVVPVLPSLEMLEAGQKAFRTTRRSGIGGMTVGAQFRAETAREAACYTAMLQAATGGDDAGK